MSDETVETADDELLDRLRAEALAPATNVVDWGTATSIGHVRRSNEDVCGERAPGFFVVADGMGGHPGGELAARTAVTSMLSTAQAPIDDWEPAIRRLNEQVRIATRARGFDRAGTAIVMARIAGGVLSIAHVGDSRAYRRRGFELQLLTRDHTVREDLLASGIDVAAMAGRGAALHALTRHVGGSEQASVPSVTSLAPVTGDRILLCTDGVHRQLADEAMVEALCAATCDGAARRLVELSDAAGGRDNATACVIEFGETP